MAADAAEESRRNHNGHHRTCLASAQTQRSYPGQWPSGGTRYPIQQPERLVMLWEERPRSKGISELRCAGQLRRLEETERGLYRACLLQPAGRCKCNRRPRARAISARVFRQHVFPSRVQPILGRSFRPIDGKTNDGREGVLSYALAAPLWRRYLSVGPKAMLLDA